MKFGQKYHRILETGMGNRFLNSRVAKCSYFYVKTSPREELAKAGPDWQLRGEPTTAKPHYSNYISKPHQRQ